ncbi:3-phosphoshikimate 1-carboxyvinyltransferase [Caulobacter sp. S45]|uniref:3-phosphoshikimate 1-carboxyvinyltransferase n=1 Tax=Caulobacter sp. S45 TaxID=1641861 RepID=UPI001575E60F|nr:3-phosphoshikimate 1-carboxyvinyltransferase [Caulobacter sp. S45]
MSQVLGVRPPGRALIGQVKLPGSKSITNRALLLAGLARGSSRLTGALKSDDTRYMAQALRAMGVTVDEPDATTFEVTGRGGLLAPTGPLFLGNAGTATRFLTAAAALTEGEVVIDGDSHMRRRPIGPLLQALDALGVKAEAPTGCPPVRILGRGGLEGGRVEVDAGLSSQYVSALLMLAACAREPVEVALTGADIGARGYVELTLAAMERFGATAEATGPGAWRVQPTGYRPCDLAIEPDASAATYMWAAERLTGGRIDVGLPSQDFTQPDASAYALIAAFPHMPAMIDGSQMQDAVPTLVVLAAFNATPVRFTGLANLRVKECDRLSALSIELQSLRAGLAREEGDALVVLGAPDLPPPTGLIRLRTYKDHRMAMSLALFGLRLENVAIEDPGCVAKTFPGYWDTLASLGVELDILQA